MKIAGREIGKGARPWIACDIAAAHNGSLERFIKLIEVAKECGADAVKFQAYTAYGDTLNCDLPEFVIQEAPWTGRTFYELYEEAHTPREWFPKLFAHAKEIGITAFCTCDTEDDVDFIETFGNPIYKVGSREIDHISLIRHGARKGKPMIISTGVACDRQIIAARNAMLEVGGQSPIFLHCISEYPTPLHKMNMNRIVTMQQEFGGYVGLSDHTIGSAASILATALGACVIEKHLTLSRSDRGPDDDFASEPHEFKAMVQAINEAYEAMGDGHPLEDDDTYKLLCPSIWAAEDVRAGELLTPVNVRVLRPGHGLPPSMIDQVIGKVASRDISRGTPMRMEYVQ